MRQNNISAGLQTGQSNTPLPTRYLSRAKVPAEEIRLDKYIKSIIIKDKK